MIILGTDNDWHPGPMASKDIQGQIHSIWNQKMAQRWKGLWQSSSLKADWSPIIIKVQRPFRKTKKNPESRFQWLSSFASHASAGSWFSVKTSELFMRSQFFRSLAPKSQEISKLSFPPPYVKFLCKSHSSSDHPIVLYGKFLGFYTICRWGRPRGRKTLW